MKIDTSEQLRAQSQLASVIQEAVNLESDVSADIILQKLLSSVRNHFRMEVSFLSKFENGRRYIKYVDQREGLKLLSVDHSDDLDASYCQRVVDGRFPGVIHNAQEMEICKELDVTQKLPVGAHISVPVMLSDNSVYGTICCFDRSANNSLNERDAAFLRIIADIAGQSLESSIVKGKTKKETIDRVKSVLTGDVMTMAYQPIINIRENTIVGYEALCRVNTPEYRSPDIWFNEAKSVGLGAALEFKALELALSNLGRIKDPIYLGINISPGAFLDRRFDVLLADLPLERLVLEFTEHDLVNDYEDINKKLSPFRNKGLRIAVDDAGAGYASFKHILQIAPDYIKLDMSLTRDVDIHPGRRALITAFAYFADQTNGVLVAEGVETKRELETLDSLGVHKAQGYLIGKPDKLPTQVRAARLNRSEVTLTH